MRLLVTATVAAAALAGAAAARAEPAPEVPTAGQVTQVLTDLADPGIADRAKTGLVQGGIGSDERRAFNHGRLKKAADHGELPLTFEVGNIWPVGPNTAAAQVTVTGPKLPATAKVFTFVDQHGWQLSSDSAAELVQTVTAD